MSVLASIISTISGAMIRKQIHAFRVKITHTPGSYRFFYIKKKYLFVTGNDTDI